MKPQRFSYISIDKQKSFEHSKTKQSEKLIKVFYLSVLPSIIERTTIRPESQWRHIFTFFPSNICCCSMTSSSQFSAEMSYILYLVSQTPECGPDWGWGEKRQEPRWGLSQAAQAGLLSPFHSLQGWVP